MSHTFQYNLDHILPIVQMRYISNPFEKLGVQLETSFLPEYPLDEAVIDYDFTFEHDVVIKSTDQLQSVFESQTCSNETNNAAPNGEFDIPIEKLITDNYTLSTQEPHLNGIGSQLDIEGFDTQNTDPFQEVELKTINDMEELQTLIFPLAQLNPTVDTVEETSTEPVTLLEYTGGPSDQAENSYPLNKHVTAQTNATNQPQISEMRLVRHELTDPTTEEPNTTYVNMDIFPSSVGALEIYEETCSQKPPVPAPRKLKGNNLIPPNSPTPQPRATTPKSTPRAKRLSTENPLTPQTYQQDRTEAVGEFIEKNDNCVEINEYTPSLYPQVVEQKGIHFSTNPPLELPTSQVPASVNSFVVYDLTESMLGDISRQINSVTAIPPPYQRQEGLLSEEEKLFRKIVDMGFHMESVKNISSSFNTKDESELIEYMLTIQNLSETNEWSPKVVETAFIFLKGETDKMKAYMETFFKYKEMGFEDTKIHSALAKCGKEYEKMLEILIESA